MHNFNIRVYFYYLNNAFVFLSRLALLNFIFKYRNMCLTFNRRGIHFPKASCLPEETHSLKLEILVDTKNFNLNLFLIFFFYTTMSNQSSISRRGLSNCYVKGSFASEVHRERIGCSLCVTLYAAWLQFAVKRPRPLASPSYPSSPPPRPRSLAAYHGVVPITDTYMSSYQTRMGTRQNIQSAKCRLSEIDIGEPAAATLRVSLSLSLKILSLSLALLHWSKTFSLLPRFFHLIFCQS